MWRKGHPLDASTGAAEMIRNDPVHIELIINAVTATVLVYDDGDAVPSSQVDYDDRVVNDFIITMSIPEAMTRD